MHHLKVESFSDDSRPDSYELKVVLSISLEPKRGHRPDEAPQAKLRQTPVAGAEYHPGASHLPANSPVDLPFNEQGQDASACDLAALDPDLVAEGIEWLKPQEWNRASPFHGKLIWSIICALSRLDCCELTALPFAGALYLCGTHEGEPTTEDIIVAFGNDFDEAQATKIRRTEAEQFASFHYALLELSPTGEFADEVPAAMSWNLRRFLAMPRGEKLGLLIQHAAAQALDHEY